MRYGRILGAMGAFLLGSSSAMAGVVVTSTYTKLDVHQTNPMTIYADSDRLKVVTPEATVIYRGDTNRMWVIMPQQRSYMEMTPETLQQLAGAQNQLAAAQSALQERLAQMPPQQRAMMEQMLAGHGLGGLSALAGAPSSGTPQIAFAKVGGGKTVARWNCDNYTKTVNGQKEEDVCIVPVSATGLAAADFQVLERFSAFIQPILSSPLVPKMDYMDWSGMNKAIGFPGLPLDTTIYTQGRPTIQHAVSTIERTNIPAGTYDLPAGLTKRDLPGMPR